MQVPQYQRQVKQQIPGVVQPPAAAFGIHSTAVGDQLQNIGRQITEHAIERQKQKDLQDIIDAETQYRKEIDELLYNPDNGLITTRKQNNAYNVTEDFDAAAEKIKQKYASRLATEEMKMKFYQLADSHYVANRNMVIRHEASQTQEAKLQSYKTNIALNVSDAAKDASAENIARLIGDSNAKTDAVLQPLGQDPETIAKVKKDVAGEIVASAVSVLLQAGDYKTAKERLREFRDQIPAEVAAKIKAEIEKVEFGEEMVKFWNEVKDLKLENGAPDYEAMEEKVRSKYSGTEFEKVWSFVQGKAGEQERIELNARQDKDRSFTNEAVTAMKSGVLYEDALKIADKYAYDATDLLAKEEYIRKLYGVSKDGGRVSTQSDPSTYIGLWTGIRTHEVTREDIDKAFINGFLTQSDWEGLRKDLFNEMIGVQREIDDRTLEYANIKADEYNLDAEERAAFLYHIKPQIMGKSHDEAIAIINNSFEKTGGWFSPRKWKQDYNQAEKQNKAWGTVYNLLGEGDVRKGKEYVMAIGYGLMATDQNKTEYTYNDIMEFINAVGGRAEFENPNSRVKLAINRLIENNQLVTAENVKYLLQQWHQGETQEPKQPKANISTPPVSWTIFK